MKISKTTKKELEYLYELKTSHDWVKLESFHEEFYRRLDPKAFMKSIKKINETYKVLNKKDMIDIWICRFLPSYKKIIPVKLDLVRKYRLNELTRLDKLLNFPDDFKFNKTHGFYGKTKTLEKLRLYIQFKSLALGLDEG